MKDKIHTIYLILSEDIYTKGNIKCIAMRAWLDTRMLDQYIKAKDNIGQVVCIASI